MSDNDNRESVSRSFGGDYGLHHRLPRVFVNAKSLWDDRRTFRVLAVIVFSLGICLVDGCRAQPSSPPEGQNRFRVSGPSMNPTLWDVSFRMNCPNCEIPIRIDASLWERAISTGNAKCWHCGNDLDPANADFAKVPPDKIHLTETAISKLLPGDLVLLKHSIDERPNSLHVKRLLAIPGQTVSIDEQLRLLVDGQIPHFKNAPNLLVDSGRYRSDSRWHPAGDSWWRYEHRLVHRGNRPGPILDDYPGNISIDRMLRPVSSISVQTEMAVGAPPKPLSMIEEIRLWNEPQPQSLGLSSENPIAVRLRNHSDPNAISSAIQSLNLYREIVYHVTAPKRVNLAESYPITLAKDEFFVVGDNVPLSLDSRSWGPIQRVDLVGRVILESGSMNPGLGHRE